MNIDGQLGVSVSEANTVLRRLQPKTVFIPSLSVFNPCFCSHFWELGQQDNGRSPLSLFLAPGHVLNSFVVKSSRLSPSAAGGYIRKKWPSAPSRPEEPMRTSSL